MGSQQALLHSQSLDAVEGRRPVVRVVERFEDRPQDCSSERLAALTFLCTEGRTRADYHLHPGADAAQMRDFDALGTCAVRPVGLLQPSTCHLPSAGGAAQAPTDPTCFKRHPLKQPGGPHSSLVAGCRAGVGRISMHVAQSPTSQSVAHWVCCLLHRP